MAGEWGGGGGGLAVCLEAAGPGPERGRGTRAELILPGANIDVGKWGEGIRDIIQYIH